MTKGLEALERLVDGNLNEVNYYRQFANATIEIMKDKDTIEKELKELKERREMMRRFNEACVPMILDNETEKKLKALEVIKRFRKDKYSKIEIDGNDIIMDVYLTLDDEEIDLLKEVLL